MCGVDKAPADPTARGFPWVWGATNVQNTKMCYGVFRIGFRPSDRRQYSGTLLRELGVTSLKITKVGPDYRGAGTPDGLPILFLQVDGSF
jgi:hypothetical protein